MTRNGYQRIVLEYYVGRLRSLRTTRRQHRFYDLLNAPPEDAQLFIGPEGHSFSWHNQETMVDFFARHADSPQPRKIRRPAVLTEAQLNVAPRGNTVAAGAIPIYAAAWSKSASSWTKRWTPTPKQTYSAT